MVDMLGHCKPVKPFIYWGKRSVLEFLGTDYGASPVHHFIPIRRQPMLRTYAPPCLCAGDQSGLTVVGKA